MGWSTNGLLTDPGTDQIVADTGALSAGAQNVSVIVWTDVACLINLVQRNALNTADVNVQPFNPAGTVILSIPINLALNQRLLLRVDEAFTGRIHGSIFSGL